MSSRHRPAAVAVFTAAGLVSATWAARIPATQERLHLSAGDLGLLVLGIETGAVLGLPAGGALVARLGSRWGLRAGFAVYPTLLPPLALAPSFGLEFALLVLWAAANSLVDVAMNAAGVELQARAGRPVLSRLHAGQSGGLLAGGLLATAAAATQLPLAVHFGAVAAVAAGMALPATGRLPGGPPRDRSRTLVRPDRRLLLLGLVAFCGFLVDGAAINWAAVDLRSVQHASAPLAAAGYTAFTAAVGLIRLYGDRALTRWPLVRVLQACGLVTAAGTGVVVLAPSPVVALAGWAVVGAGLGLLAPAVLGAAPGLAAGTEPAAAIAAVTTLGYLGSFTGPPLIGALATAGTLSGALALLAVPAVAVAALAPRALAGRRSAARPATPG